MLKISLGAAAILVLASVADAAGQGNPEPACDGNTFQMVECLKARTAQWDKRLNIAYQQALKDAGNAQREPLRTAQRLCGRCCPNRRLSF